MADFPDSKIYGEKFDAMLLRSLEKIDREIKILIGTIDRTKSQNESMAILLEHRNAIIKRVRDTTTGTFNEVTDGAYADTFKASEKIFKDLKINVPFLATDLEAFKIIKTDAIGVLAANANIDGINLFQELLTYSLTGNRRALEAGMMGNLEAWRVVRYGGTITTTSISTFGRAVTGTKAIRAGVEKFEFAGPPPVRQWCNDVGVGTVLTKKEIDALPAAPGGMDPFFACGGWNCRHRWVPVVI